MPATYFRRGAGRSIAARDAEDNGRLPLSRAKKAVADEHGCPQAVAAAALELIRDGKYAARCDYYDTGDARLAGVVRHIVAMGGAAKFKARRDALRNARRELYYSRPGFLVSGGRFSAWAKNREHARAAHITETMKGRA